ncbi:MAG TPA: DUF2007 domain-containing protein [Cryomorphaceae bacterium]|nr:DUF2007 domain-containing protein [Cryomorphaceae bacterium]
MKKLVKIITDSSITVNRIAMLLEDNGISTHNKDNVESARLAGFGVPQNSVDLYVYESEVERAQKIIADFNKENEL